MNERIERILALFQIYGRFVESSDFELGCPVGSLAMEVDDSMPEARASIARTFQAWKKHVADCLEQARPELPAAERRQLASLVLTLIEGALVHARAERSLEPFSAATNQLRQIFALLQPGRKP